MYLKRSNVTPFCSKYYPSPLYFYLFLYLIVLLYIAFEWFHLLSRLLNLDCYIYLLFRVKVPKNRIYHNIVLGCGSSEPF